MKNLVTKVVFFGNERIATGVNTNTPVLLELIKNGYEVAAIVINQAASGLQKKRPLEVAEIAERYDIPLLSPIKTADISAQLISYEADIAVLVAYGKIIPQSVIDIFPKGIINVHPSLLPKFRGSTPIESALLAGVDETGVTIMKLVKEMDAGPIYSQSIVTIAAKQTKQNLANSLSEIGSKMIIDLLPGILSGDIIAINQDEDSATYSKLLEKNDGEIDWQKQADEIEREIRAYANWPGSKCTVNGMAVAITEARVLDVQLEPGMIKVTPNKTFLIGCRVDSLEVTELQPAGKNKMSAAAFLNGYGHLF